ncbi:MAG: 2'-5' RNA ligase family protein [Pseudomonadota bacterium]
MIYVLAYPAFDPAVARRVDDFRARHEPQRARLVPPHITLVFGSDDSHLPFISDLVDRVADQTAGVSVGFNRLEARFDPFEGKHKLFLLCGEGSDQITDLHHRLYDGPHRSDLSDDHPFVPHMTVATQDERKTLEQIDTSALGDLPIRTTLSALELVRFDGSRLTTVRTAPFGG